MEPAGAHEGDDEDHQVHVDDILIGIEEHVAFFSGHCIDDIADARCGAGNNKGPVGCNRSRNEGEEHSGNAFYALSERCRREAEKIYAAFRVKLSKFHRILT